MDRRREDGEGRTQETHYLDRDLSRLRNQYWVSSQLTGTLIQFIERNCPYCANQNYGEEMIDRLANKPYQAHPCKEPLTSLLNKKQYSKFVMWDRDYRPQKRDCPKFKQEVRE